MHQAAKKEQQSIQATSGLGGYLTEAFLKVMQLSDMTEFQKEYFGRFVNEHIDDAAKRMSKAAQEVADKIIPDSLEKSFKRMN